MKKRVGISLVLNQGTIIRFSNRIKGIIENFDYYVFVEGSTQHVCYPNYIYTIKEDDLLNGKSKDKTIDNIKHLQKTYNNILLLDPPYIWYNKEEMLNSAVVMLKENIGDGIDDFMLWYIDLRNTLTEEKLFECEEKLIKEDLNKVEVFTDKENITSLFRWNGEFFSSHYKPNLYGKL